MISLNKGQKEAVKRVLSWYFEESETKHIFKLFGYSGVGKSTVIQFILEILGLTFYQVLFATPAGKAASVLRHKGIPANTIHRTLYNFSKGNGRGAPILISVCL
jgi:exodeoxyribonuclease-5